jgi:tetratricopeptide (TPR) repeat protein
LGQLQNAEADLRRGIGLAGELPDYYWLIFGYAFLGQCLLRQDRHQEGLAALDLAQQIHVERGIGGPAMYHLRIVQAETYLSGSERESIGKAGSQLKKAETALKGAMKLAKAYRLFLPEAYRQQGTLLWLQGKQGAAEAAWQRSLEVAEALHQFYEKGVTHLEMGVRLKQRSHLDQSEMILSETGAGWHLAKLQPLLSTAGK